jgi:UDP-GlcNAc:undecaprenyl-phosphate GlcNAc-1-phosphate transferase
MLTYFVTLMFSLVAAAMLTPLVRGVATRLGVVSLPGGRHIHQNRVPRLGGVAIFLAALMPLVALTVFWENLITKQLFLRPLHLVAYLGGATALVFVGAWDDARNLRAWKKLVVEIAVAIFAYRMGLQIHTISTPLGPLVLGSLSLPFTVLWIVGITNAINLIDGLDGLAAGVSIFALMAVFGVALTNGRFDVCVITVALGGALVGFLIYNFHPASIFMGDSGSLVVGYLLATTGIGGAQKTETAVALLVPIVALGVPILDTLLAIFRRSLKGERVSDGDREHIHHRLLDGGLRQRGVVLVIYFGSMMCVGAAFLLMIMRNERAQLFILGSMLVAVVLVLRRLGLVQLRAWRGVANDKRAAHAAFERAASVGDELGRAILSWDVGFIERVLGQAAELVDAVAIEVVWRQADSAQQVVSWQQADAKPVTRTLRMPVPSDSREVQLQLSFNGGERLLQHDAFIAMLAARVAEIVDEREERASLHPLPVGALRVEAGVEGRRSMASVAGPQEPRKPQATAES